MPIYYYGDICGPSVQVRVVDKSSCELIHRATAPQRLGNETVWDLVPQTVRAQQNEVVDQQFMQGNVRSKWAIAANGLPDSMPKIVCSGRSFCEQTLPNKLRDYRMIFGEAL
ncbi:MAG TPA: hypothetical protein VMF32_11170 [Xanthobacteraceae bacterium]|nr:hypothetical protein [Xanthobacteraceae bacterium]